MLTIPNKKNKIKLFNFDWILFVLVLFLVSFGLLMVYSASSYNGAVNYNDSQYFLKNQLSGAIIGLAFMILLTFFDHKLLCKLKWPAIIISIVLLALVFVPFLGVESYGAKRWLNVGITTIQPSEIAKFGFIIFASASLSQNHSKIKTFCGILPTILAGVAICVLIIVEPNMSITMVIGLTMLAMLYIGGARFKHLILILIPIMLAVPVLIIIEPYRLSRLYAFIDPWSSPKGEGYQLIQSLYSLGSGGWFGLGLFNSRQKYLFLPFSESDFIFSIIGEEFGFVGAVFVLLIFAIIIIRAIKIAIKANNRFGAYLATGIACIIAIQVFINVAVVTGSIPPTGLPLPFISFGGSSLVMFMSAVGILLNISKTSKNSPIFLQKLQKNNKKWSKNEQI